MRKFLMFAVTAITMVIFLPTLLEAQEVSNLHKKGQYYIATIEKNFDISPGGALVFEKVRGDITVTSWDKTQVYILEERKMDVFTKKEAETALERTHIGYRQDGSRIIVGGAGLYRNWMQSTFTVKVPKEFNIDLDTKEGDLNVSAIRGEVKLNTSGGDIDVTSVQGTTKVSTSGGDVTLTQIDGSLQARTSGGDIEAVDVTAEATLKTSGGDIELTRMNGPVTASTSGGDIELKESGSDAVLKTSGGNINLQSIDGDVQASTSGGDIHVSNAGGGVKVSTSGGDIVFSEVGGPLDAKTAGGDIKGRNIDGGVVTKTAGGDIKVSGVKGFVDAMTAGGDLNVEITLTDFSMDHHVTMKTAGGDITLTIPENMPATVAAYIEIKDHGRKDYNVYSDFPLTIEAPADNSRRRNGEINASGDINGGGDAIDLETVNGNIYLKKLR